MTSVYEYPIALLRDTVAVTAEPTHTHPYAEDGLVYLQTYSPFKELFDVRGDYPFSYRGLINLGYGRADAASFDRVQNIKSSREGALKFDMKPRQWIRLVTEEAIQTYGWRTELREEEENWAKFLADYCRPVVIRTLRQNVSVIPSPPSPVDVDILALPSDAFFVYRTEEFKKFIRFNVHKHLVVMDAIRILHSERQPTVHSATAQLYALLALCFRHFISYL
ncbi:hypothetical protein QBC43DRAFT_363118 [Cladorrhinum sp. PSN259]|nr:hypothetical protein QBC43DRAFT_363118 [Cladorrhinum sp. PSN259]